MFRQAMEATHLPRKDCPAYGEKDGRERTHGYCRLRQPLICHKGWGVGGGGVPKKSVHMVRHNTEGVWIRSVLRALPENCRGEPVKRRGRAEGEKTAHRSNLYYRGREKSKNQHADRALLTASRNLWGLWAVLPLDCGIQEGLLHQRVPHRLACEVAGGGMGAVEPE